MEDFQEVKNKFQVKKQLDFVFKIVVVNETLQDIFNKNKEVIGNQFQNWHTDVNINDADEKGYSKLIFDHFFHLFRLDTQNDKN